MRCNLFRLSSFLTLFALSILARDTQAAEVPFIRCDPNNDIKVDIADAVWIIQELFIAGSPKTTCRAALDCNNSDSLDLNDAVFLVLYLFRHGQTPSAPFPSCGIATAGTLSCLSSKCPR